MAKDDEVETSGSQADSEQPQLPRAKAVDAAAPTNAAKAATAEVSRLHGVVDWVLKKPLGRYGVLALVAGVAGPDMVKKARANSGWQLLVSALVAFVLFVVALDDRARERKTFVLWIAAAYTVMGGLYLVDVSEAFKPPQGYEAVTDCLSTLLFVGGWYALIALLPKQEQGNEWVLLAFLVVVLILASVMAAVTQTNAAHASQHEAARLMLNIANGGILFGLYATSRKVLAPADPINHAMIVLFACVQIAAHGRDCAAAHTCGGKFEEISAMAIAWLLLLGKVSFGWYVASSEYAKPKATSEAAR